MSAARSMSGETLLAVFAHPDDESLAAGGLLAMAADAGATVALLCLTRGEAAAGAEADDEARRRLGEMRTRELVDAARTLGVRDVVVFDHPDGMLPWFAPAHLEADIRRAIDRVGPGVVVTFGPDGLYWHPDHIAVHERTTAVVAALGDAAPALYYVTTPPGQMRAVADEARRRGAPTWIVRGLDDPDAFGALAEPPTLIVDARPFAARKLAAVMCHVSQIAGGALDGLAASDGARLLGTEHYRRAAGDASSPGFIERFRAPSTAAMRQSG